MSKTTLAAYRDQALTKIEPIDLVSIPDDLRNETRRLQTHIEGTYKTLGDIREKRARRAALLAFLCATLPILALSLLLYRHGSWSRNSAAFVSGLMVVINFVFFLAMHDVALPRTAKVAEIEANQVSLNRRLSKLQSLDRLTEQSKHAAALLDEARSFNRDLENLGADALSHQETLAIEKKRTGILARVGEFRKQVLAEPENRLLLLPDPPDDRT